MKQDCQQYCHEGVQCVEQMMKVSDQVSLRVLYFTPAFPSKNIPIVMVDGLSTAVESFRNVIYELARDFPVYYIETREKTSSKISGKVQFGIEAMGLDIISIIELLGLEDDKYILIGYSMGATIISDGYRFLESKPNCMILIEPTPVFHYPKWSIFLIRWFGGTFYWVIMPFGKWYLGKFIINKKEDNEMALITSNSLDQADPGKLRSTILAIAGYKVWDRLNSIRCPVLIVATSKDRLHIHDEINRMVPLIKNCTYIDLETNQRTHSAEMAHVIRNYVTGLS